MPRKRKGFLVVQEEDEVVPTTIVLPPKSHLKGGFAMTMQDAMVFLGAVDLTRHEYRVMLGLLGNMEYRNIVNTTQQSIADQLGMERTHVNKAIKGLCDKGFVFKDKDQKGRYLRISAVLVWKGTPDKEFTKLYQQDSEHFPPVFYEYLKQRYRTALTG